MSWGGYWFAPGTISYPSGHHGEEQHADNIKGWSFLHPRPLDCGLVGVFFLCLADPDVCKMHVVTPVLKTSFPSHPPENGRCCEFKEEEKDGYIFVDRNQGDVPI